MIIKVHGLSVKRPSTFAAPADDGLPNNRGIKFEPSPQWKCVSILEEEDSTITRVVEDATCLNVHEETWFNNEVNDDDTNDVESYSSCSRMSFGERIRRGEVVGILEEVATIEECEWLCSSILDSSQKPTSKWSQQLESSAAAATMTRIPSQRAFRHAQQLGTSTSSFCHQPPLSSEQEELVNTILQRIFRSIDQHEPSILQHTLDLDRTLYNNERVGLATGGGVNTRQHKQSQRRIGRTTRPKVGLENLFLKDSLTFACREPAINIYHPPNGEFRPHIDGQAMTILVPLTTSKRGGGGTAFWSPRYADSPRTKASPSCIVRPSRPGTAILFGGSSTLHAGLKVDAEQQYTSHKNDGNHVRMVLVASISIPSASSCSSNHQ